MATLKWQREVAKAIRQLTQEVHELNPGLRFDFDMDVTWEPVETATPDLECEKCGIVLTDHDGRYQRDTRNTETGSACYPSCSEARSKT